MKRLTLFYLAILFTTISTVFGTAAQTKNPKRLLADLADKKDVAVVFLSEGALSKGVNIQLPNKTPLFKIDNTRSTYTFIEVAKTELGGSNKAVIEAAKKIEESTTLSLIMETQDKVFDGYTKIYGLQASKKKPEDKVFEGYPTLNDLQDGTKEQKPYKQIVIINISKDLQSSIIHLQGDIYLDADPITIKL